MQEPVGDPWPIVVQKYGGSSVADSNRLKQVAQRIVATRRSGKRVVVVVSAMSKTTDELLARAKEISSSPNRRELDMLLSCGERTSMALLAMAIHELGEEAVSLTGSQSGIMTNDRHSGARIIEVRPHRVADELAKDRIVIVAGFQGVSYKREITTLGRGGSDTTAVALAGALGAEYCEICSDVDGIYTTDPRVVDTARLIDAITCGEMLELAAHGAKVLHASCVEMAQRMDIALYARATQGDGPGTRIHSNEHSLGAIAGIAGQKGLVRVQADNITKVPQLLQTLMTAEIAPWHMSATQESTLLWLSLENVPDWRRVRDQIDALKLPIVENVGAVSMVGNGLGLETSHILGTYRIAEEIGVKIVAVSTSPLRITLFCAEGDVDNLVLALHRKWLDKA